MGETNLLALYKSFVLCHFTHVQFDCFEDHEAFIDLLNFKKFPIIGRKGSGKTAIFKKILMIKEANYFSFGHTFSDYPWHFHDKQARTGIPDYDK